MDKYYLFSEKISHAVKVSITLAISLLLFAFGQAAVGHESGYSPTGANAPNMMATNFDVGVGQPTIPFTHLTVSGTFVTTYNGTTAFTFADASGLKGLNLEGVNSIEPDIKLTKLTGTITVGGKNVGNGKTFTITSYELSGSDLEYYDLSTTSITVDILPAELTLTGLTVDNKVYDGLLTAKLNYGTTGLTGFMFPADGVILRKIQPNATFDNKDAANGKAVTLTPKQFVIRSSVGNLQNEYNYALTIPAVTANITARPLLVEAKCIDKVYNHNDIALPAMITLTDNRVTDEVFDITYTGASFATDDAGTAIPVTVQGIKITSAIDAANYTVNVTAPAFASITQKGLTISGISAENKIYDGNNIAVVVGAGTLDGLEGIEAVTLVKGSGTFNGDEVGEAKDVTFTDFLLEGIDKVNYTLSQPPSAHANIELRPLLILATASGKEYDGDTDASVILSDALSTNPRVANDIFDITFTPATFADPNAEVNKAIIVSGINISGTDAKNYSFNTTANTKATITPVQLTITGVVGGSRTYDGTNIAPFENSAATLVGNLEVADNVTLKLDAATPALHKYLATGTFADKNVGNKLVTIAGFEIADLNSNKINYVLTQPLDVTASIMPQELSVIAVGVNKQYDGKTVAEATLTPDPLDLIVGDALTFTYVANFTDQNVADGKTVNVKDIVISSGNEAGNYTLEHLVETATANIIQKVLSVNAVAMNRVYDGKVDADAEVTLTPDPSDVALGDVLTIAFTDAHFSDKTVAVGKTVTVEGITIASGNDANNYILEKTIETPKADITKLALTVDASVLDKVYNSETNVVPTTVTLTSSNKVGTDDLSYAFSTATFSDENVGDRTVLVEGIGISGLDAPNYLLQNETKTTPAKITPKDLTVTATGVNKVYDGATKAVVTFTTLDMIAGDAIGYDYTANFKGKDVDETGIFIPIAITNIILNGDDAGNYKLTNANASASTEAKITPRELIITGVTAADKIYNHNTVVANWNTDNAVLEDKAVPALDLVKKDNVTLTTSEVTAAFINEDAGLKANNYAKEVQFAGFKIMGDPNEYNYSLVQPKDTAKIIPVNLRITGVTAADKIYDGNKVAILNINSPNLELVGLLAGDETVTLVSSAAIGEFAVKDAVEYQKVTTSLFALAGDHAGNYEILQPVTNASITDKTLVLTATSLGKIYNGNYDDVTLTFSGWAASDDISVKSYKGTYLEENVADNITINATEIVLEGVDLKNYNITAGIISGITAHTTGNISARTLKITGVTAVDRTYNSSVVAILDTKNADFDPTDFISGDDLQLIKTAATGTFGDADVATAIPVTTSGFTLEGTDKINYSLVQPSTLANITPAILTISDVTAINKIYDGTNAANLNSVAVLQGVFALDAGKVTLHTNDATATFVDKNAGLLKPVIVTKFTLAGDEKGDYLLTQPGYVTADITKKAVVVSAIVNSKPYDGNDVATISENGLTIEGIAVHADGVEVVNPDYASAIAHFVSKNADEAEDVNVTGIQLIGTDAVNYTWNSDAATHADITYATLKVINVTAKDKTYDGNVIAEVTGTPILDGIKGSDKVILTRSGNAFIGNFTDKNAGPNVPVIVTGSTFDIEGADVLNYNLDPLRLTANINPIQLSISGVTADNKVYDGSKSAVLSGTAALVGTIVANEVVTLDHSGATGTFASKNVGNQEVTPMGYALAGADVLSNYTLNQPSIIKADITAKLLVVTATAQNKEYDGSETATATISVTPLTGDVVTAEFKGATFANKTAVDGKIVTLTGITLTGADAANYIVDATATSTAAITAKMLPVIAKGVDKVYDGITKATVNLTTPEMVSSDAISTTYTANFSDKNVGSSKGVNVTEIKITGADAANYAVNSTASATAAITAKPLTAIASGIDKVYDGSTTATVNLTTPDMFSSDVISTTYAANFSDKNVGSSKGVTVTAIILGGADAANYSVTSTASTTAAITAKSLPVIAKGVDKVYDGLTAATVNLTTPDMVSTDAISTSYVANFSDKNVGSSKGVSVTAISLGGVDAANYTADATANTTAAITAKMLPVIAKGLDKVYDGNTTASVNLTTPDMVSTDAISTSYVANFSDKNVGSSKDVSVTAISLGGVDAANYTADLTANATATITAKPLTAIASGIDKVYDGLTMATVNLTTPDMFSSDAISTTYAANFSDKNVGSSKGVSVTAITLGGADAANYTVNATAVTNAAIKAKMLAVTAAASNKVYDGNTTATVNLTDDRMSGDIMNITNTTATFDTKAVGTGKTVTVNGISLSGADALNYTNSTTATTTANITSAGLPVTITGVTANSKVYDGTAIATLNTSAATLSGVISSDVVTLNSTSAIGTLANMNVGTGNAVTTSGFVLAGEDAGNYAIVNPALTTNITAKQLTINVNSMSKCFGTTPTLMSTAFTTVGLLGTDMVNGVTLTSTGTSATAAAGTFDIVASNAIGTGLSNYTFNYVKGTMTVNPLAVQPDDFTVSTASVCKGSSAIVYRVPNDPTVTYNWSYSGTGATITGTLNGVILDFSPTSTSGTISVTATNACATSTARTMAITVNPAQIAPVVTVESVLQIAMTSNSTTGNQWYDINGIITGATAQNYTAIRNGSYYVMVTGNCTTMKSNIVSVTHVSVPEFEKPIVNVYPNPSNGEFWVKFKALGNEKLKMIQVYNSLGKAVYQATPKSVTNDLTEWVSVKNQPAGVYILVLTTDNQKLTRQIVITK